MSSKKEIQEPGLDTEEAKELELDEQPKPTRKVSNPSTPISNKMSQVLMIGEKEEGL
jgi:hypothetical protein